ncbi:uncharacterized protein BXIN_2054 [Babesia sp. Xinjiang]|uniref:uncharacterized protein n=1 Tax=Babesia sp. Xinjiang TaxID=462227 RepID=UPI000A261C23|nr:uncharacterized protein BXIN_2054 [Babesia sp. Xinjiang]ORM40571.1 hypothetical protein BXIN_2054 [Babesia sp. Xinjiang]
MGNTRNSVLEIEATLGAIERVMNKAEVETLASVNSAYANCTSECGPLMQYIGAGYYVKRAPLVIKRVLERGLAMANEEETRQKYDAAKTNKAPKVSFNVDSA